VAKVLFVMTGANHLALVDGSRHPTGFWADEAVIPLQTLKAAGHEVQVATPGGAVPPVDAASLTPDGAGSAAGAEQLRAAIDGSLELAQPLDLASVDPTAYDAVFFPGGHGPMQDLATDPDAGRVLTQTLSLGKPVALVCHGPAALLAATDADGRNAFAGYTIAAFTDEEERLSGLGDKVPWLLQTRLAEAGLNVKAAAPFGPHVEVDRNLLTGQNPASAGPLAGALIARLAG